MVACSREVCVPMIRCPLCHTGFLIEDSTIALAMETIVFKFYYCRKCKKVLGHDTSADRWFCLDKTDSREWIQIEMPKPFQFR